VDLCVCFFVLGVWVEIGFGLASFVFMCFLFGLCKVFD
jgi:hypothetical protein